MCKGTLLASYMWEHYGDLASVLGLLISLIGFAITLWTVRKARRAAEEAKHAAREALARIRVQVLANEIGRCLHLVGEIDSACRKGPGRTRSITVKRRG